MRIGISALLLSIALVSVAQNNGLSARKQYEDFKKKAQKQYTDFRDKANQDYANFMEKAWKKYTMDEPVPAPQHEELEPVVWAEDTMPTAAACFPEWSVKVLKLAAPKPQPQPVAEIPVVNWANQGTVQFSFYGTTLEARFDDKQRYALPDLEPKTIAEAWRVMSDEKYNNTVHDCLQLRNDLNLNDWAYLQMLQQFSEAVFGKGNEAGLLTAFLYTQSGYKTRIVKTLDTPEPTISMLFGTEYLIYNKAAIKQGNLFFYPVRDKFGVVEYVDYPFPNEQSMSLEITNQPKFTKTPVNERHLEASRYPSVRADVKVDENLIKFYNDYPVYSKGQDFMNKWAFYANTPLDPMVKEQLYPQLKAAIDTVNKNQGVEQLLNLVHTSMQYGYDEPIWGYDRAFFAEESLYYPYCDCEDHAILFSRLVRDLLGLEVLLVYYPGHLATAVDMGATYPGDGVMLDGKRYTICDPICPYRAGRSHPNVDKTQIQVIKLN